MCIKCATCDIDRCDKGHPLTKDRERAKNKIVCNSCQKTSKHIYTCEPCNFDICLKCVTDPSYNKFKVPEQKATTITNLRAQLDEEDESMVIEIFTLEIAESGEVKGKG